MTEVYVAATSAGGLDDPVSPVFGRAPTFTVVEVEGGQVRDAVVLPNPYVDAPSGAGIQAAQLVAERSPRAAFAGSFGPNATGVLSQAGIAVVPVSGMPVREAVEAYLAGRLSPAAGLASRSGFGPGMGPGMGRGMGQRMGRGMRVPAPMGWPPQARPGPAQPEDPRSLVEKVDRLESELAEIKRKLCELKGGG